MSVARTLLVTIATLKREVDVVANADVPLSEVLRPVSGALGLRAADIAVTVARSGDVTQAFTMGFTQTLDEAGVADGDRLSLHPFTQRPSTTQSPRALQVEWLGGEN